MEHNQIKVIETDISLHPIPYCFINEVIHIEIIKTWRIIIELLKVDAVIKAFSKIALEFAF